MLVVVYCFFNPSSSILFPVVHSGDKYINGEIIPCTYPTYQPKERRTSKYESRRYERRRDGPPANRKPRQQAPQTGSASSWGRNVSESVHLHRLVPKLNPLLTITILQAFIHIVLLKQKSTLNSCLISPHVRTSMHIHPQLKISAVLCNWPAQSLDLDHVDWCWYFEQTMTSEFDTEWTWFI